MHIEYAQVPLSRDKLGLEPDGLFEGVDLFTCQIQIGKDVGETVIGLGSLSVVQRLLKGLASLLKVFLEEEDIAQIVVRRVGIGWSGIAF